MNNELEIRRITEQVLKDQNLWNLAEIYKKEHNIFRGTHKGFASGGISWDAISGKPSTFPPSSHSHAGLETFLELTDTPSAYTGEEGKVVHVNSGGDGLEFRVPNYNIYDPWFRELNEDAHVKLYGNSRQMVFRTDGETEYAAGIGAYAWAFMYGGNAVANRKVLINSDGTIWMSTVGWIHSSFIRSNADSNVTGHTEWQDNYTARFGNSADFRIWHNGANHYLRGYTHGANVYIQSENASGTNRTIATFDPDNYRAQFYQISTSNILYANYKIDSLWTYNYTTTQYANAYIFGTGVFARSISSIKYKDKIKDLELDPSLIYKLRPVSFQSKCEMDDKNIRRVGLIAEEVDEHIPGIVIKSEVFERAKTGRDRSKRIGTGRVEVEGIDYNSLIVLLLAGHQRHEARIKALEN